MSQSSSRRSMLKVLAGAPAALALTVISVADAQESTTCETPEDDGLPQSLEFNPMSPDADKACHLCTFWTADSSGQCGDCQMMHRTTPSTGVCVSFAHR